MCSSTEQLEVAAAKINADRAKESGPPLSLSPVQLLTQCTRRRTQGKGCAAGEQGNSPSRQLMSIDSLFGQLTAAEGKAAEAEQEHRFQIDLLEKSRETAVCISHCLSLCLCQHWACAAVLHHKPCIVLCFCPILSGLLTHSAHPLFSL